MPTILRLRTPTETASYEALPTLDAGLSEQKHLGIARLNNSSLKLMAWKDARTTIPANSSVQLVEAAGRTANGSASTDGGPSPVPLRISSQL